MVTPSGAQAQLGLSCTSCSAAAGWQHVPGAGLAVGGGGAAFKKIHEVIKKPNISLKVRNILEQMHTYDNIPRKKVKFQNWMVNSFNVDNSALQDEVWDIFSEATSNGPSKKELKKPLQKVGSQPVKSEVNPLSTENEMMADKLEKKKSKRERKEERQKNKKTEKKDMKLESQRENFENKKGKSKKEKEGTEDENEGTSKSNNTERKKKKHERNNTAQVEVNGNDDHNEEERTNTKKQKRKHAEEEPCTTTKRMKYIKTSATTETESEDAAMETEEIGDADKGKFNWKGTIKAVLKKAPNNEISIKKLRKKVLAQYHAVAGEHHKSQEDLLVIFNKKVNNNPKFKVLKDKVKLMI
nr:cell growth-regulating nucleolar protein isoform X2 [Chelonoidis abingdonii]